MHTRNPGWVKDNHWVVCQLCGRDFRAQDIRYTWDGLKVCKKDWESRHPQELIKPIVDQPQPVGPTTGKETITYVSVTFTDVVDAIPTPTNDNAP